MGSLLEYIVSYNNTLYLEVFVVRQTFEVHNFPFIGKVAQIW